jgi:hypothetical protein
MAARHAENGGGKMNSPRTPLLGIKRYRSAIDNVDDNDDDNDDDDDDNSNSNINNGSNNESENNSARKRRITWGQRKGKQRQHQ